MKIEHFEGEVDYFPRLGGDMTFEFNIIREGSLRGIPAFILDVGEDEVSIEELAEVWQNLLKNKTFEKSFLLKGNFEKQNMERLLTFIKQIKAEGYLIFVKTKQDIYNPIFNQASWLMVDVDDPDWTPFRCNEVRYLWDGKSTIEPHPVSSTQTLYTLVKPEMATIEAVQNFLHTASHHWRIEL